VALRVQEDVHWPQVPRRFYEGGPHAPQDLSDHRDRARRLRRPVRLTPEQQAKAQEWADAWTRTLIAQANNDSDPETRENARTLLRTRGISWAVA
jgi:hypothetical protein